MVRVAAPPGEDARLLVAGDAVPLADLQRAVQLSIQKQLLGRNVGRLRRGLEFKAHRLMYFSTQGSSVMKKCGPGEYIHEGADQGRV
jgi:hypothetical protein